MSRVNLKASISGLWLLVVFAWRDLRTRPIRRQKYVFPSEKPAYWVICLAKAIDETYNTNMLYSVLCSRPVIDGSDHRWLNGRIWVIKKQLNKNLMAQSREKYQLYMYIHLRSIPYNYPSRWRDSLQRISRSARMRHEIPWAGPAPSRPCRASHLIPL